MYFEDIAFHTTVSVPGVTIEKEKMLAFAREYDPCPLHVDEAYARSTHFGDLIAPGVMSLMSLSPPTSHVKHHPTCCSTRLTGK